MRKQYIPRRRCAKGTHACKAHRRGEFLGQKFRHCGTEARRHVMFLHAYHTACFGGRCQNGVLVEGFDGKYIDNLCRDTLLYQNVGGSQG